MSKIRLTKNVETISWSDEPDAKVYRIDFTDGGLQRMYDALKELKESLKTLEDNPENASAAIESFIVCVAGQECYDDALAYVDEAGVGAEESSYAMLSLVTELGRLVGEHAAEAKGHKLDEYLRADDATADLV